MTTTMFWHTTGRFTGIFLCLFLMFESQVFARQVAANDSVYRLSMQDAMKLGKANNMLVKATRDEASASNEDLNDARVAALPTALASSDYERFTSITLYNDFLGKAHAIPNIPSSNGADASVSAEFNLYSGGKQRAFVNEQVSKKQLAQVNSQEQAANIGLQVVARYLDMVSLIDQKKFIQEQIVRAQTRVKNINALYNNQKVTRSDLLRAQLQLSSVKLNLEQVENDMIISNQKLNVLLNLPDSVKIQPIDSANQQRPIVDTLLPLITAATKDAYAISRSDDNIKLQKARISGLKSNYAPSVSLFSMYGLHYPNNIFYPPIDQAYSIGYVGIKIQYIISSTYQNKHKMSAGLIRLQELQYVQQNVSDNVREQAGSLIVKYREALDRITVNKESIEQARVNYKIVNAKYFNQLALLTDLLDADNLYEESRFNLVQAQTNAQFIYYQLLYTSGKL